ncbi:MAG TPA: SDR family NAD(P)-dependent oxidoreductase [Steroidobacteraceae bacterium]|nr:SDR family NAD(P)-dependent oxidoreductase [Steroidobacteraceae bacterium]
MSRVFITGSTDGLGLAAARALIAEGHEVVLHARSSRRAGTLSDLAARSAGVVIGDLGSAAETRSIAEQVRGIGRMDAVIHNAGIYREPGRGTTPEGARENAGGQYVGALPADRLDRAAGSPHLSQQRHASRRRRLT